jgi:CHAD domain-containing protein
MTGLAGEAVPGPIGLPTNSPRRPRLSGAEVVGAVLHQFAANFLLNEVEGKAIPEASAVPARLMIPGFVPRRRGDEAEMLHQARVSLRRLRSTVRIFDDLIDPAWSDQAMDLLSWYGGILSGARDLTVLRERILEEDLPIRSSEVRQLLRMTLDRDLDQALRDKDVARLSTRYWSLLDQLLNIDERVTFSALGHQSARRVLAPTLDAPWRELRESAKEARREPTAIRLHDVRIKAKRLQHGSEAVALVEGKRVHQTARAAEALQRRLGSVHDATVAEAWLRELASSEPEHSHHLLQLAEWERVDARVRRRGWRDDLRELRARWRSWH